MLASRKRGAGTGGKDRLFHILVALGAGTAASGCSGTSMGSSQSPGSDRDAAVPHVSDAGHLVIHDAGAGASHGATVPDASYGTAIPACEHSQQLTCRTYVPQPLECVCNLDAPLSEQDCKNRRFECAAYDPPTGCECVYITGPR